MNTLSNKMNLKFGKIEGSYILNDVKQINSYETLCLICSDLNINLSNIDDSDFDSSSMILNDFCSNANDETGYAVSVWFNK